MSKFSSTWLASEPALSWAWMTLNRFVARPSCRKKIRWPTPHRGAERNSCPLALPWLTRSCKPAPILCTAISENGLNVWLLWPVNDDLVVARDSVWQRAQPMAVKMFLPRAFEAVAAAATGAAERRMNAAKFTVSDAKSEAGLMPPGVMVRLVVSSGLPLNTQPGTALRSL